MPAAVADDAEVVGVSISRSSLNGRGRRRQLYTWPLDVRHYDHAGLPHGSQVVPLGIAPVSHCCDDSARGPGRTENQAESARFRVATHCRYDDRAQSTTGLSPVVAISSARSCPTARSGARARTMRRRSSCRRASRSMARIWRRGSTRSDHSERRQVDCHLQSSRRNLAHPLPGRPGRAPPRGRHASGLTHGDAGFLLSGSRRKKG